jgi:hypothetical protein
MGSELRNEANESEDNQAGTILDLVNGMLLESCVSNAAQRTSSEVRF